MKTLLRKKHIKVTIPNEGQFGFSFVIDLQERSLWLGIIFIVIVIGVRV